VDIASFVEAGVPAKIVGDPVRLNQILSNLVNNALKFTETGYVAISVRPTTAGDGSAMLEFSVIDTGIGIAGDKLGTVFKEFSQADQTTTRKFGGTGLGLSICKKLVATMKGVIDVESVVNRGSRFFFTIPVEVVEQAPALANCHGSEMQRASVLLDGLASKQSVAGYLNQSGVQVSILEPDEAGDVEYYATDAVFACASVVESLPKRNPGTKKPYVVAISQLGDVSGENLIKQGLADDIMLRPVGRNEMYAMIDRLGSGRPRRAAVLQEAAQARQPLPQFSTASVLVADDNAVNREVIIEVLRQLGVNAKVAKDGREAVDMWAENTFDLVFMDCSMPVMDGYAATAEIRKLEAENGRPRTGVIALTAHIAGDNQEKWQAAGMDDFITKPFTIRTIAERMALLVPQGSAGANEPEEARVAQAEIPAVSETTTKPVKLPVLDEEVINDLKDSGGGSDTLLLRVFELFVEHAPNSLQEIKTALANPDQAALADAAHGLKSMCANIGAARAAESCHELELAARNGEKIDAGGMLATIYANVKETLACIEQVKRA